MFRPYEIDGTPYLDGGIVSPPHAHLGGQLPSFPRDRFIADDASPTSSAGEVREAPLG